MKLANVQGCVWTVTQCVHVFLLQVLVHMLQTLALRTKVVSNALNIGGLLMIIVEIWNHLFCVFMPRILPAAGLLRYPVEGRMEKSVFYSVQCGFKHKMWDREREKWKENFSFAHFPVLGGAGIRCITPVVFPQARSLNYATFIITWLFSFMLYGICKMVTKLYVVRLEVFTVMCIEICSSGLQCFVVLNSYMNTYV